MGQVRSVLLLRLKNSQVRWNYHTESLLTTWICKIMWDVLVFYCCLINCYYNNVHLSHSCIGQKSESVSTGFSVQCLRRSGLHSHLGFKVLFQALLFWARFSSCGCRNEIFTFFAINWRSPSWALSHMALSSTWWLAPLRTVEFLSV